MTTRKYTSRSQQTTLTGSVTSGATVIPVVSATTLLGGATVSTGQTFTVVIDPDTALEEVVDITAISSNNLTVTRPIDGSSAQDHSAGAVVRHMIIGRDLRESNTHIEASNGVHGLASTSAVVGTQDTQTLYNKTLVAPTLTSTLENDTGITFEGATADSYETFFTVTEPTQDNTITLPNTSGTVDLTDSVTTLTNKTITSPTINGTPVITGLSSAGMSTSSATPKSYVDNVLVLQTAQATAAATSAASAATSASSAATSASSALTSQTAAATSASSAATSASSSLTSQTAAATSASSAATSQAAAATSAASAATSAASSAASTSAAATSATSAAASATAAATSATSAAASATAAATSATSAAASATAAATSATSSATSASAALTSANSAATSASSALTSQTAAATSASSAATSAASAATSASSSLTTYNTYKTYYLGSFASAPTLDNQGNALITGATYFNSGSNIMYVYTSSTWNPISSATAYSAPTLGSTTINSGTTYTNVTGLTLTTSTVAADPTTALGIASKQYVDAVTAAINFHAPVRLSTTANIAGTYSNGSSSGIGATFTTTATGRLAIDSVNVTNGDRVLLKNQTTDLQNGIYTVTTQGSAGVSAVLTRSTDYDQAGEITNGDVIFTTAGTVNTGATFVNAMTVSPTVVGTTSIIFSLYTSASLPSQTGNAGYLLTTDGTVPSWTNSVTNLTLVTPALGAATATSINGTTIPTSATLTKTTDNLSVFAATTSAQLAGVISDETGTGVLVFATSPTLVTPAIGAATGTSLALTGDLTSTNAGSWASLKDFQTLNIMDAI